MAKINYLTLLTAIRNETAPVGAVYLSKKMDIPPATIGRLLKAAEDDGYVTHVSNKGRCLTEKGEHYLKTLDTVEEKKKIAEELIDITSSTSGQSLIEVLEIRMLLEPYTAALACKNATEEDIAELEELAFEQMMKIRRGGRGSQADLNYHLKLAQLSGNDSILRILRLLLTENGVYNTFTVITNTMHLQQLTHHMDITAAIKARDPEAASTAIKRHLELLLENTRAYLQQKEEVK